MANASGRLKGSSNHLLLMQLPGNIFSISYKVIEHHVGAIDVAWAAVGRCGYVSI